MIPGASGTDNTKGNGTVIPKKRRRDSDGDNDEMNTNVTERKKVSTSGAEARSLPVTLALIVRRILIQMQTMKTLPKMI